MDRDSRGRWDGLRVVDGAVASFYPLGGARTDPQARAAAADKANAARAALEAVERARHDPFLVALDIEMWGRGVTLPRDQPGRRR